jgi:thiol-disulfide isomerase/thioredoxin
LYIRGGGNPAGFDAMVRDEVNCLVAKRAEVATDLVRETDEELGRFDLLDAKGQALDLRQYRGKLVVIDFWATWCSACRPSLQHTNELRKEFDKDIVVIAPTLDTAETRDAAAAFLREKRYDFLLVFDDENRRTIRVPFAPSRLLLDRAGRLRFVEYGSTPAGAAAFEHKVRTLLR